MKKNRLAAQLYSFRDFIKTPKRFAETLSRLKQTGYDAVQLSSSIAPMPEAELRHILDGEGMTAPTAHEPAERIVNATDAVIERLLRLDCRHVAYPYPHELPGSEAETLAFARRLNLAAEKMAAAGIALAYHNHAVEFTRFGRHTMLELIYANAPALEAEIDTYWVQAGGGDPTEWIITMASRMKVVHIKDYGVNGNSGGIMMPVGSGNLNWRKILTAAEAGGVEWFVVEHDGNCDDPFESFRRSMAFLTENVVN